MTPSFADSESSSTATAENTAEKQRGRPFPPGQSGNQKGRPPGSRNKTTLAMEALLDGESEAITRKLVAKALEGDTTAIRLCIDRLVPARRDRPVEFNMPPIKNAADLLHASSSVLTACADGTLSPNEAMQILELISTHTRILEFGDLEARLRALEEKATSYVRTLE